MANTLDYYNHNAVSFVENTRHADMHLVQDKFLALLNAGDSILDFGCGSGRDTKYFLEKGYHVVATDGSAECVRLASAYTGIEVKEMLFQDLSEIYAYDGIWACSSILHLPKWELLPVLQKMCDALKFPGVIYTSFKYGEFEGERNGRYFTEFTEQCLVFGTGISYSSERHTGKWTGERRTGEGGFTIDRTERSSLKCFQG